MLHLIELLKAYLLMKDILPSQQPCIEFTIGLKEGELCDHMKNSLAQSAAPFLAWTWDVACLSFP